MFKFDTTLQVHLELRSISLALPTGLSTTLVAFNLMSMPPFFSGLNGQTTQTWLATSKLPQPRVNLIDIAATPAVH